MALASAAVLPRLGRCPCSLRFSVQKLFFSIRFLPPYYVRTSTPQFILPSPSPLFSSASSSSAFTEISPSSHLHCLSQHHDFDFPENPDSVDEGTAWEEEEEDEEEEEAQTLLEEQRAVEPVRASLPSFTSPNLSVKEKKELASYAHSLGKKLKSQQVGKSGITPAVAAAMLETLEANELLKLKVHGSCPGELGDVIKQLESATGSTAVGEIGRTVILYRPSLSKMKKEHADGKRKHPSTKPLKPVNSIKIKKKGQPARSFSQAKLYNSLDN
ncbi:hypothetical protein AXF42_Ash012633 [Apostasia shenzhenica]|uniref:CRM domain-containing protein n=1 Tax=Apostasia shenzhenica TaxID=1088818 RepID=A0A2H9ZT73_9ASPA|nr:hypothetical protein AXF42_Ash012633 [Apostasia shenzhenica]